MGLADALAEARERDEALEAARADAWDAPAPACVYQLDRSKRQEQDRQREAREALRDLTDRGRKVSALPGPEFCGIALRYQATSGGVRLQVAEGGGVNAGLVGVQRCASQHACPACAASRGAEMARELEHVIRHVIRQGGTVMHLTLTLAHDRATTLSDALAALQAGWHAVTDSRDWDDVRKYGAELGARMAMLRANVRDNGRSAGMKKTERDEAVRVLRDVADYGLHAAVQRARVWADRGMDAEDRAEWLRVLAARAVKRCGAPELPGLINYFRALEATWGQANGWHPHLHILLFFPGKVSHQVTKDGPKGDAERLQSLIYRRYLAGVEKHGFTASEERGVVLDVATDRRKAESVLGKYLNKVALEVARPDLKRPKSVAREDVGKGQAAERFTPFGLLEAATSDRPELLVKWHEWQTGTRGLARVSHGADWGDLVDAATPEAPEQLPEVPTLPDDAPAEADRILWSGIDHALVMRHRRALLRGGELHGWAGVIALLDVIGVRWMWGLPPVDGEAADGTCGGERTEAHRHGECSCWVG